MYFRILVYINIIYANSEYCAYWRILKAWTICYEPPGKTEVPTLFIATNVCPADTAARLTQLWRKKIFLSNLL